MKVRCPSCQAVLDAPDVPAITIASCATCRKDHTVLRIEDDDDLAMASAVLDRLNMLAANYIQARDRERSNVPTPEAY